MKPSVGLCDRCAWTKVIENKRGSVFHLCERSLKDPRYRKYPPLPVLTCAGFELVDTESDPDGVE